MGVLRSIREVCARVQAMNKSNRLDTEAGLAPVSPLGVVAAEIVGLAGRYCGADVERKMVMLDSVSSNEVVENVPDSVTGPQADPLGDGTVLLLGFGKLLLGAERLLRLYVRSSPGQLVLRCPNHRGVAIISTASENRRLNIGARDITYRHGCRRFSS